MQAFSVPLLLARILRHAVIRDVCRMAHTCRSLHHAICGALSCACAQVAEPFLAHGAGHSARRCRACAFWHHWRDRPSHAVASRYHTFWTPLSDSVVFARFALWMAPDAARAASCLGLAWSTRTPSLDKLEFLLDVPGIDAQHVHILFLRASEQQRAAVFRLFVHTVVHDAARHDRVRLIERLLTHPQRLVPSDMR